MQWIKKVIRSYFFDVFDLFRFSLRTRFVVLPNHYYSPIADVNELVRTKEKWARRSKMVGIDMNLSEQIEFLRRMILPFQSEYRANKAYLEGVQGGFGGYGPIEAQAYHGLLRALKPRRVIEIGAGVSTHCAMVATAINALETGHAAEIICIEPNPNPFIRTCKNIVLMPQKVEHVAVDFFASLGPGDLLFIDSSHAVRPAGDVIYLYCEVLPRLAPGAVVHIHDIYFPFTYQHDLLTSVFQWSETCMLQTLLVNNNRLKILFCMSLLHYDAPDALLEIFPDYSRRLGGEDGLHRTDAAHFPASIYLQAV
jgi:predicted O-methyltransferase YrrM